MSFLKKLFGIKEEPKTVVINVLGNNYNIDISPEAQQKRKQKYELDNKNRWKGSNQIESVRDDGYLIYKLNRVSNPEREQIGIYGLKWFSNNNEFCVVYLKDDNVDFNIGLVKVEEKQILYKVKLERPHRCRLTNNGLVICEDCGKQNGSSNYIYVIGIDGTILYKKRHNSVIGDTFELFENETKFKYNINYTGQIHIINLSEL